MGNISQGTEVWGRKAGRMGEWEIKIKIKIKSKRGGESTEGGPILEKATKEQSRKAESGKAGKRKRGQTDLTEDNEGNEEKAGTTTNGHE